MYRIVASNGLREAALEKEGKLYHSYGPEMVARVRARDAHLIFPLHVETCIKKGYYKKYEPPLEVANIEDWPAAVRAYEERIKNST